MEIMLKRAYEPMSDNDGYRILVDRLWPRGLSKERAHVAWWAKELTPSPALRTWYHHNPDKWADFQQAHRQELQNHPTALTAFENHVKGHPKVTLIYAAKDTTHTHALILKDFLDHAFNRD